MRNHWSLVVFTLTVQCAVGSVWCLHAALLWNAGPAVILNLKPQLLVALGLVLTGLAVALAHLGKPGDSMHAVRNFKKSWLSREIFSVNLFSAFLAVMAGLACINPGALNIWVMFAGSLAAGAVLYAMIRVYWLRTVPSWNHAGTPLAFIGSALILGGLLCTLVLKIPALLQMDGHDAMGQIAYRNVALIAVLMGFIFQLMASGVKPIKTVPWGPFKSRQPVLQGVGVALGMVYVSVAADPLLESLLLVLAAVFLVCGETLQRIQFYDSYQRVGL
jgi:anaerobic dimethyl sulfoxide reductase subunit C (anchor subunit)